MLSLRLLGNIFDLEILFGERSGTFRDYATRPSRVSVRDPSDEAQIPSMRLCDGNRRHNETDHTS